MHQHLKQVEMAWGACAKAMSPGVLIIMPTPAAVVVTMAAATMTIIVMTAAVMAAAENTVQGMVVQVAA